MTWSRPGTMSWVTGPCCDRCPCRRSWTGGWPGPSSSRQSGGTAEGNRQVRAMSLIVTAAVALAALGGVGCQKPEPPGPPGMHAPPKSAQEIIELLRAEDRVDRFTGIDELLNQGLITEDEHQVLVEAAGPTQVSGGFHNHDLYCQLVRVVREKSPEHDLAGDLLSEFGPEVEAFHERERMWQAHMATHAPSRSSEPQPAVNVDELKEMLSSDDPSERLEGVRTARRVRNYDQALAIALYSTLADPDHDVGREALLTVAEIDRYTMEASVALDRSEEDAVLQFLQDSADAEVLAAAMEIIAAHELAERAQERLLDLATDPTHTGTDVRPRAVRCLGMIQEPDADVVLGIGALLMSDDMEVAEAACGALRRLDGHAQPAIEHIERALGRPGWDALDYGTLAQLLLRLNGGRDVLLRALPDMPPSYAAAVFYPVCRMGPEGAAAVVDYLDEADSEEVARQAVAELGKTAAPSMPRRAAPILARLAKRPDYSLDTRKRILETIGESEKLATVVEPDLVAIAQGEEPELALVASQILVTRVSSSTHLPLVLHWLESDDPMVALEAVRILGEIGETPRGADVVLTHLRSEDTEVRTRAATVVRDLGPDGAFAVPALIEILETTPWEDRREAPVLRPTAQAL
ncbi:MAG: hypothetical protein GF320_13505, partial [Armatimonadia bacterium]|nr:hypothetical protein [Armatimonadia bacterium]